MFNAGHWGNIVFNAGHWGNIVFNAGITEVT